MSTENEISISEEDNYNECYLAFRQIKKNNRFNRMVKQLRYQLNRFEDEDIEFKLQELNRLIVLAESFRKEIEENIK